MMILLAHRLMTMEFRLHGIRKMKMILLTFHFQIVVDNDPLDDGTGVHRKEHVVLDYLADLAMT